MSAPGKTGPLLYALVPLVAVLAVALIARGWHGSHAAAILRTPPRQIIIGRPPRALNLTNNLQVIQDRALFYATRKFYDPVLATPAAMRALLSSYQLMGTLLIPQKPGVAFLREGGPGGAITPLSPGNQIEGWTLKAVQSGRAVFSYAGDQVTLTTPSAAGGAPGPPDTGITRMRIAQPSQRPPGAAPVPVRSIPGAIHLYFRTTAHANVNPSNHNTQ